MGTPEFALPSLRALLDAGHELALVVAQPDRPAGRGRHLTPPPVARLARERGLPLYQTATLRTAEARAPLGEARPETIVVAAFGLLLPLQVLELPRLGCVNVHPSLLPRHRGAAPIPATLLAGDHVTGVTIMLMEQGLDSGPVLSQWVEPVLSGDDAISLDQRLAKSGADLLLETLPRWETGEISPRPQDATMATYAPKITHADGRIDWSRPAAETARQVRAYRAWPTAHTSVRGEPLKILTAEAIPLTVDVAPEVGALLFPFRSGRRLGPPAVSTGAGLLALLRVVPAGRPEMSGEEWVRGLRDVAKLRLGVDST